MKKLDVDEIIRYALLTSGIFALDMICVFLYKAMQWLQTH
jgi:hypothetical protein